MFWQHTDGNNSEDVEKNDTQKGMIAKKLGLQPLRFS